MKQLCPREIDILNEIKLGKTNLEIAQTLGIKKSTVEKYVRSLLLKLEAKNRIEAVYLAYKNALIV